MRFATPNHALEQAELVCYIQHYDTKPKAWVLHTWCVKICAIVYISYIETNLPARDTAGRKLAAAVSQTADGGLSLVYSFPPSRTLTAVVASCLAHCSAGLISCLTKCPYDTPSPHCHHLLRSIPPAWKRELGANAALLSPQAASAWTQGRQEARDRTVFAFGVCR